MRTLDTEELTKEQKQEWEKNLVIQSEMINSIAKQVKVYCCYLREKDIGMQ